ncbi:hypothetical protein EV356DRAFT_452622 [Viridothelium virens]|uniref:Uncharacterized protein n=1 Tax=Viridothelium virens TaxID=1048519 RepID=A0A6A6GZL4_VIRVR|nr:hypothetical protein EV356DRAFT_452622 [Viridothelium virens]
MARATTYPLYNSTYTVFRISPLYHGNLRGGSKPPLSPEGLQFHSRQLRDSLSGNFIRGVGIAQTHHDYADTLQDCSWSLLGNETHWDQDPDPESDAPALTSEDARGIYIQLRYEKSTHCAMLLRDPAKIPEDYPEFTTLPLLLLRMPASVRESLLNYLQLNFDCNVSPHNLQSIDATLERFVSTVSHHASSWSQFIHHPNLSEILGNVQVQISFPSVAPLLKNMDMTIAATDVMPFLEQGKLLIAKQPQLHGHPFMTALGHYLDEHLALRLDHKDIHVSKIVCSVFALSADGKIKIFAPERFELAAEASSEDFEEVPRTPVQVALDELYGRLIAEVMPVREDIHMDDSVNSSGLLEKEKETGESRPEFVDLVRARSPAKRVTARMAQGQAGTSDVPDSPPPPYALHDVNIPTRLVQ